MKLIRVKCKDDAASMYAEFKNYVESNRLGSVKRRKDNIIGIDSFERQENTYEDKELEKAVKKFYPNSQLVIRRHPIAFGEKGYDIRATVTLKNKEDFIPAKPSIRYSPSNIDENKVEQAVKEINEKFPMDDNFLKRAHWNRKKGQIYISCEIPIMELKDLKKQDFLSIIKKYFPKEKIKTFEGSHVDRGFKWVNYIFYILENN